jgi:tetratricopeptide (TPR) repeat protein
MTSEGTRRSRLSSVLQRQILRKLTAGAVAEAEELLQRLEVEDPLGLETRGFRLELSILTGREPEAESLAQQLLELFPGSARIQLLAGRLAYGRRQYAAALGHFEESERLYPHWWSRLQVGRSLSQLGRFQEAEAILLSLLPEHGISRRDLAWLYERMDQTPRALELVESYLQECPNDALARSQRLRLRARLSTSGEFIEEVDGLLALGEGVDPELAAEFCDTLFRTGESARAREFIRDSCGDLAPRIRLNIAWTAYKRQAYDIALDLFLEQLPEQTHNPKFLSALEAAGHRMKRLERVIEAYERHAEAEPPLYGRLKKLRTRVQS